jgi:hypothetical protein
MCVVMDRSELSNRKTTFGQHSLKRTVWGIKKNQNNQNNKSSDTKFIPAKRHDKNIPPKTQNLRAHIALTA